MGVMLDANYRVWDAAAASDRVGWPLAPVPAYGRIAADAGEYAAAGFSAVRFPPSTRGGAGTYSDGYDKFDDYSTDGTAFGDTDDLRRAVACVHAHGMQAYGDLVLHQYGGGTAEGVYATKRFPKDAGCFVGAPPRRPVDDVPDQTGNFAFGDMVTYQHSLPADYMHDGALAATRWLVRSAGFDGLRIDDAKGTWAPVVYDILQAEPGLFAFAEYFDGNPAAVGNWVNVYMRRRASVLDFAFKFNVGDICNNQGRVWMGQLSDVGWCCKDAATSVTFVESADTDNSPGEQVVWNKMLGYAVMLTFPGYPTVYYRDWSDDPGCYGLKDRINNLVWVHEHLAQGDFVPRLATHPQVFAHERMGYGAAPGCLCVFNNDPDRRYTVQLATRHAPGTRLHEYTGHYDTDVWVANDGSVTVTVAENVDGLGYLVFAPWVTPDGFGLVPTATTQVIELAADLSTGAVQDGARTVGYVHASAHPIAHASYDDTLGGNATDVAVTLVPDGTGRYAVEVTGTAVPDGGLPATVTVTYMGA